MLVAVLLAIPLLVRQTFSTPTPSPEALEHAAKILQARQAAPPGGKQEGRFTFYQMPTPLSGICDLCEGPDGALWGIEQLVNNLVRLDPETGEVEEYPIPFSFGIGNATIPGLNGAAGGLIQDRLALSCAIRSGADGKIYATNGLRNQLVQMTLETREIKLFQSPVNPTGNLFPFNDLFTDSDGMWMTQTTANILQFFDYAQQDFTITAKIPTSLALPLGVFVTSDGSVYGCELLGNKIFEYKKDTGEIVEYDMPLPLQAPAVNRVERDGYMYFSVFIGNALGRINLATKEIEVFPSGQLVSLGGVTSGPSQDGDVWMSFFATTNALLRLSPEDEISIVRFPNLFSEGGPFAMVGELPIVGNLLQGLLPPYLSISVNVGPGNAVWFGSFLRNAVGRYQL
ncbi:uncharacterized protein RCC_08302 [Ramularia collo-cygni]|uniref:SMP-30/Gluconolactonase/LRE-like region domain-containing protein n=1 Tax=Ramularia collo-cygni TaxID=112498 RepID=A0A2D3UX64_9PEZI|nr:uncharacterized protein RCC_08302 [Ramularia collo-cygni]CZT22432.1 uncharacterized protein RCC_08302 [Ramularia collo-cygni]